MYSIDTCLFSDHKKNKNKVFVLCRLEGLYGYIHNGIPVLSNAESKMKNELEEIEEYLKFHRGSLQQVHSSQLICWGVAAVKRRLECCYLLTLFIIFFLLLQIKAKNSYTRKSPRRSTSAKSPVVSTSQQKNIRKVLTKE